MIHSTRTISVTSGKGGVGKTNLSLNLALELSKYGFKTCVFDADLGLANINILLGITPEKDLEDVINEQCPLTDIIIRDFEGIDIIPGSSGVERIASLEEKQRANLASSLNRLDEYDYLIFDTSAGISINTIAFCLASSEVLLIITPEPTSMTDAYALLKVLDKNRFKGNARVVVNQCSDIKSARIIYNRFKASVNRYLSTSINLTGIIVQDSNLVEAVKQQQPFLMLYPQSKAAKCIIHMAKILIGKTPNETDPVGISNFWDQYISILKDSSDSNKIQIDSDGIDPNTVDFQYWKQALEKVPENGNGQNKEGARDFDALLKGILDISFELHRIRSLLENSTGNVWRETDQVATIVQKNKRQNSFELNFDAYAKKQQISME